MQSIEKMLISKLIESGFSEPQAIEAIETQREPINKDLKIHGLSLSSYDYDTLINSLIFETMKPHILNYIDTYKPNAWFRALFTATNLKR
ncbi:hypothetical protein Phi4:1_gp124 [Cellulophaga phage phi4:1]|uniref:Uncharacterized protein n=5 Tax=Lightbulbvirus TaxID=1918522 RepID=A0A0S2MWQ5_9CAUD|nr:hypothetical protein Phi4:1_gp124 [Cellulophaga phage phi4:1]YP_008241623.1 hypothetical protein Phi17:2_gp128 [Cellulophaga phage phi17:2]ALO80133.1 hypothetical protein Phi4113_124 [Cellulophaga phage phi4:1_13]ALO80330.1 hypothetical protein Phi4118_124 [Cellulophaga phage phi4:1_18]ALO80531.1 hypothetical protein Phi17218_128 [Cellulophaga phage phi17:2_18]AGO47661.1 hypothetical protein Phi17:2_gp128 [Cellulophaga phage phi17:2]AGO49537.1 hypothetical protein Phi4:1_gp124 [Cellulophag|tara:strand:+ start:291 stop:560 length:270 start_codon:yes stop_codon:yes gene_type:complete